MDFSDFFTLFNPNRFFLKSNYGMMQGFWGVFGSLVLIGRQSIVDKAAFHEECTSRCRIFSVARRLHELQ